MPGTPRPIVEEVARFPANGDGVEESHAVFDRLLDAASAAGFPVASGDAVALRTAVGEIIANIVEHACGGLPDAHMSFRLARFDDRLEATFEDPGIAYAPRAPRAPEALPQRGMGLGLVRASVDAIEYRREGAANHWRLVRRLKLA